MRLQLRFGESGAPPVGVAVVLGVVAGLIAAAFSVLQYRSTLPIVELQDTAMFQNSETEQGGSEYVSCEAQLVLYNAGGRAATVTGITANARLGSEPLGRLTLTDYSIGSENFVLAFYVTKSFKTSETAPNGRWTRFRELPNELWGGLPFNIDPQRSVILGIRYEYSTRLIKDPTDVLLAAGSLVGAGHSEQPVHMDLRLDLASTNALTEKLGHRDIVKTMDCGTLSADAVAERIRSMAP